MQCTGSSLVKSTVEIFDGASMAWLKLTRYTEIVFSHIHRALIKISKIADWVLIGLSNQHFAESHKNIHNNLAYYQPVCIFNAI